MLERLQVIRWHILKYSNDQISRNVYQHRLKRDKLGHYGKGRRISPCLLLEYMESQAKFQDLVGNAQCGKAGLGYGKKRTKFKTINQEKRHQLVLLMRREAERKRLRLLQNYQMQNS